MNIKVGKQCCAVYALDFETHADAESAELGETGVWLSCLIDDKSAWTDDVYDYDVPSLFQRLETLSKTRSLLIYVFNLAFEWSFILPFVRSYGFVWNPKPEDKEGRFYSSVTNKTAMSVWEARLRFEGGKQIVFRDLSKVFKGSLRSLAKEFGLETQKGEINYELNRRHGHAVTDEEKRYCFNDTRIVIEILEVMKGEKLFWQSLSSSSYAVSKMVEEGFPRSRNPYRVFRSDWHYPELGEEETEFLRHGVSGGIAYATPRYHFADIRKPILHIDAHQMHPSSAYLHIFPYGKGEHFEGAPKKGGNWISCCHIRVSYRGVKLHSVIKLIGLDMVDDMDLWVWDFEIPTMMKCYENLRIEYVDYWRYQTALLPWRDFYRKNYEERKLYRSENKPVLANLRKLWNNGSYGKLLERGHDTEFENYIELDGLIDSYEHKVENPSLNAKYTYLPVGSCIPAYSRVKLIETALLLGWENIIYFDTDSIFAIDTPEVEENLKKVDMEDHLGGWGREPDIIRGQFTAPKRYKIMEGDDLVVHTAGFSPIQKDKDGGRFVELAKSRLELDRTECPFDEINITSESYLVKRAYRVRGGTMILLQKKTMEVQPKYRLAYEANKDVIIE